MQSFTTTYQREKKMTDKKYNLPPRKWYNLEQAIKRIQKLTGEELEIADLIHYWLTHKIEICIYCNISPSDIKIGRATLSRKGGHSLIVYLEDLDADFISKLSQDDVLEFYHLKECDDIFFVERQSEFAIKNDTKYYDEIVFDNHNPILAENLDEPFYINGFLSVIHKNDIYISDENRIISTKKLKTHQNHLYLATPKNGEENRATIEIINIENFYLNIDDLYILNQDLEDFITSNASPPRIDNKPRNSKTLNLQAEFIRNLITIFYNEETANNIRSAIDNGKIKRDFELRGLSLPSGKTVDKWINS